MRKYAYLLADKGVRRWYQNLSRRAKRTADNYLRKFGNFCQGNDITPQRLLRLSERRVYELLLDHVTVMEGQGAAGSHIWSVLKAVKSWLSFNGKEVKRKIRVEGSHDTPTLRHSGMSGCLPRRN